MQQESAAPTQPAKLALAEREFTRLVSEIAQRGFYGTAGLVLSVQDGHIQHVRVTIERLVR